MYFCLKFHGPSKTYNFLHIDIAMHFNLGEKEIQPIHMAVYDPADMLLHQYHHRRRMLPVVQNHYHIIWEKSCYGFMKQLILLLNAVINKKQTSYNRTKFDFKSIVKYYLSTCRCLRGTKISANHQIIFIFMIF